MPVFSEIDKALEVQICKKIRCLGIFLVFVGWSVLVINEGCKGPDLVDLFEVPKMFQKVLQYVRESKLAILEELKPPKNL